MNRANTRAARRTRERRLSAVLFVVAAVVLFCGLFGHITLRSQISDQNKQITAVKSEIVELKANAGNMRLSINQRHNLAEIGWKAELLGMSEPDSSSTRVISLPAAYGNTSTQTVANDNGEELMG